MHREKQIRLEVFVLDEDGLAEYDDFSKLSELPAIHWYGGRRGQYALGLLKFRADVTLYDHVGLARLQGLLPKALSRPYLLLIHSVEIWNNNREDYHRTARKAELLIANSEYTARKAKQHYPDLPEIVVCWPGKGAGGTSLAADQSMAESIGSHAMLIVGRLDTRQRHKGHDQLIEAMPIVLKTVPDAQLIIAGNGDDRERLEQKSQKLGVANNVVFLGKVAEAELHLLYNRCALFVMPSDGDGFGLVFLEAMMHGLPCVGLEQGAAAEIFEGGKSGVLVDRENVPEMAATLSSLLLDQAGRIRLGEIGRDRYQAVFRQKHHANRFHDIVTGFLANR